jgi:Fe2+ transport system protein FeoA
MYGADAGTELEIGFQRHAEIRLIHKRNWGEIRPGEMVFARFVEYRRVREGRDEQGVLRRESDVLERRLVSMQFEEPKKKTLISGDGQ